LLVTEEVNTKTENDKQQEESDRTSFSVTKTPPSTPKCEEPRVEVQSLSRGLDTQQKEPEIIFPSDFETKIDNLQVDSSTVPGSSQTVVPTAHQDTEAQHKPAKKSGKTKKSSKISCLSCTRVAKNSDEDLVKSVHAEAKPTECAVVGEPEQQTTLITTGLDRPEDSVPVPSAADLTDYAKEPIPSTPECFEDTSKFISLDTEEINEEKKSETDVTNTDTKTVEVTNNGTGANKKSKNKNKKKAKKGSRKESLEEEQAPVLNETKPVVESVITKIASASTAAEVNSPEV